MSIRARQPTGRVPYPLLLVEGPEKAGKSYAAALLSASDKVGQTYWLDLGEGSADEYGAIPNARYLVLEHDGSWRQIVEQVAAVKDEARRASDASEPPVVLVIDSITAAWEGLKDWAAGRARSQGANVRKLKEDPNAEVVVGMNLWNDAGGRHRRLMTALMTFPGIVVMIARGKEVARVVNGRPVEGQKDYRVEAHKDVAFDSSVWVRMSHDRPPLVIGARSVAHGVRPGVDEPKQVSGSIPNMLEWIIFDVLGVDPGNVATRDIKHVTGGDVTADDGQGQLHPVPAVDMGTGEVVQAEVARSSDPNAVVDVEALPQALAQELGNEGGRAERSKGDDPADAFYLTVDERAEQSLATARQKLAEASTRAGCQVLLSRGRDKKAAGEWSAEVLDAFAADVARREDDLEVGAA